MFGPEPVDIPDDYLCPITQKLMENPVVAADGHSYEKEAIVRWVESGRNTSPITNEVLKHTTLIDNYRLKAIINNFKETILKAQREKQIKIGAANEDKELVQSLAKKEQESILRTKALEEERMKVNNLEQELAQAKAMVGQMQEKLIAQEKQLKNHECGRVNDKVLVNTIEQLEGSEEKKSNLTNDQNKEIEKPKNAKDSSSLYNLGVTLQGQGKLEEAIKAYISTIELNPDHGAAFFNLGLALYSQGKFDEAIRAFKSSLKINLENSAAFYSIGLAQYSKGDLDEAIRAYKSAIEIDPRNTAAFYNLGVTLQAQGKREEAIRAYTSVIEIDPKHSAASYNLNLVLKT